MTLQMRLSDDNKQQQQPQLWYLTFKQRKSR